MGLAASYAGRVGLAAWRRKSALLLGAAVLALLVLGLQYGAQLQPNSVASSGVKFVKADPGEQMAVPAAQPQVLMEDPQREGAVQAGQPQPQPQPQPYVPPQRLAHLDLKGAPPRVAYLRKVFALLQQAGATGVLLEWEDTLPFWGPLAGLAAGNAYSRDDVRDILEAARENGLEVMPLVQTFGHVELALKHAQYASLREVPDSPQALCPSNNASMDLVAAMIAQVMELHPDARFLHVGCDEVFQMGECPRCRAVARDTLFLAHVSRVARLVREKYRVTPIIWHDMLQHLPAQQMEEYHLGQLVEPMVWVYAEDVYRFVPTLVWDKFASVFPRVWAASAFKGAFGETMYIPNVRRHLDNNLRWLEVMATEGPKFKQGFQGLVITGWQRYDHFAVLCELLPAAIPSLGVSLVATSHGYINSGLRTKLNNALGCVSGGGAAAGGGGAGDVADTTGTHTNTMFLNLNSDPFLWDSFSRCFFPGVQFFRLTYRLHNAERELREFLLTITKAKGWMTDYNVRHNFSSPLRVDELMMDHPRIYHTWASMAHAANEALSDIFDSHTITEWVEQRIYPDVKRLEKLAEDANILKSQKVWPRRPLPPLPELKRLGVSLPVSDKPPS